MNFQLPIRCFLLLLLGICLTGQLDAQTKRPKVGLVLSGGGARGLAEIGVLKAMEKAGLRPDYITGTSMGSILGGLYALGYSADQLDSLARNTDWKKTFSNKVSFDKIAIEEKPYYGRYILETPVKWPLKINPPLGLIEGQNLTELLADLTRPAGNISDFNDLPIPFACMATDIATGQPVVLRHGNLSTCMRASMAIPMVFTPVWINDTLLVDGGLVRNFPVQEVIDMGADIVIGVFVSTDLLTTEKLNNFIDIMIQSSWVMSTIDTKEQRKKVDLYIEPDLGDLSSADFGSSAEMIKRGDEAGEKYYPIFKKMADSLDAIAPHPSLSHPLVASSYQIGNISIQGNLNIPTSLILGKLKLDTTNAVTEEKIDRSLNLLYGTNYFDNVSYQVSKFNDQSQLRITVRETAPNKIKAAIHYDTENKAGINFNYTIRNLLLPNSRTLAEIDFAESPRVNLNYLKYLGASQRHAGMLDFRYESFKPEVTSAITGKKNLYRIQQLSGTASLFSTDAVNSSFGGDFGGLYFWLKPLSDLDSVINSIENIRFTSLKTSLYFKTDNFNERYYPTRGMHSELSVSYYFAGNEFSHLHNDTITLDFKAATQNMWLFHGDINRAFPLTSFLSLQAALAMSLTPNTDVNSSRISGVTVFGGTRPRIFGSQPFYGAGIYDYSAISYITGKLDLQFSLLPRLYLTGGAQYINIRYPMEWLLPDFKINGDLLSDKDWRLGYGLSIGYLSVIGPITISFSMDSETQKLLKHFGMGFYF